MLTLVRELSMIVMLFLAAACASSRPAPPAKPTHRPNIVLVVVDDLGWADLGCCGSVFYETPNIDRLARQGMRFTHAYAACAVCSPTRASVMTGRYPARIGITDWIRPLAGTEWTEDEIRAQPDDVEDPRRRLLAPRNPRWMEHHEITIAELLKQHGYATGFIGKWHLGPEGWFPEDQGFDCNVGGCDLGHPPHYFDPYPAKHQRTTFPNLAPRRAGEYLTDREADEAVRFIREHAAQPFFLCLCHYAVHSPIQARRELIEHYEVKPKPEGDGQDYAPYAAMVHSVDDTMGRILHALEDLAVADETLIIFTSDNGGATHFRATDNRPLRSGKGRPYEGGIRVPLLVRWPARVPAGVEREVPVCTIDLLPTICDALGIDIPRDRPIDGVTLMPLLTAGGSIGPRALFWHYPHYWWGQHVRPYSIVRAANWKLIKHYEDDRVELYDLERDPSERRDLSTIAPEKAAELDVLLVDWLREVGAKLPRANPAYRAAGE